MAFYEHVMIVRSDMSSQQVETLTGEVRTLIEEAGGKVCKSEYWGLRSLAHPINKARKAHYSMLGIEMPAGEIAELERRQRMNEDVLRFLTIRVDAIPGEPSPMMQSRERSDRRGGRGGRDGRGGPPRGEGGRGREEGGRGREEGGRGREEGGRGREEGGRGREEGGRGREEGGRGREDRNRSEKNHEARAAAVETAD